MSAEGEYKASADSGNLSLWRVLTEDTTTSSENALLPWTPPSFVSTNDKGSPEARHDVMPHSFVPRRWSKDEQDCLAAGVQAANLAIEAWKEENVGLSRHTLLTKAGTHITQNVWGIDWEEIARNFVKTRSASECLVRWVAHDHPLINKASWDEIELSHLEEIAQKQGHRDWRAIALELGTNRTAAQCFATYRRNEKKEPRKWTDDEDLALLEAVKVYGTGNWQQIAAQVGDRTGQQCLHRYLKSLEPKIRKGTWLPEEDEILKMAVEKHGVGHWAAIAREVPGRTDRQCRERWVDKLDPSIKKTAWTSEEDRQLITLVREHGTKWSKIATQITGRPDYLCKRRYKLLQKRHPDMLLDDVETATAGQGNAHADPAPGSANRGVKPVLQASVASLLTFEGSDQDPSCAHNDAWSAAESLIAMNEGATESSTFDCGCVSGSAEELDVWKAASTKVKRVFSRSPSEANATVSDTLRTTRWKSQGNTHRFDPRGRQWQNTSHRRKTVSGHDATASVQHLEERSAQQP